LDAMTALNMLVEDKTERGGVWGSGPPYQNMPNGGQNMQGGPRLGHDNNHFGKGATETETMPCEKQYMGRLIGQKGVTINDLQARSNCDIQLNQDVPPGHLCQITMRGNRQGIDIAKRMISEIISSGPNHAYAGGTASFRPPHGYQQHMGGNHYQHHQGYHQQHQMMQHPPQQYAQSYAPQQSYGAPYGGVAPYHQPQYAAPPMQQQYPSSYGGGGYAQSVWRTATAADGQVYYYNEKTGETQWEKPPGMP